MQKDDIKKHQEKLSQYQTPKEMEVYVENIKTKIGEKFFSQPGLTFLREAWLAAEFGKILGISQVKLTHPSQEWPDFETKHDNITELFECVEADVPERKRSEEYQKKETKENLNFEEDPEENWTKRAEQIPEALNQAIKNKISKNYSKKINLLVYLNIQEYGFFKDKIEKTIQSTIEENKSEFKKIYILWKDKIYSQE